VSALSLRRRGGLRVTSGRLVDRMAPTARQAIVLRFIAWSVRETGCSPTLAEIAGHMDIAHTSAADHVERLARRGLITIQAATTRGTALTTLGWVCIAQQPEPVSGIVNRETDAKARP
jgi:SOS-response transcriptional repressor LexA